MEDNMKLRKVSLILVITIAMLMIASIFSASYAKSSSPLRLSIKNYIHPDMLIKQALEYKISCRCGK